MSKLAKKPLAIPTGVSAAIKDRVIEIKGKNAALNIPILPGVKVSIQETQIQIASDGKDKQTLSNLGTMTSLLKNALLGAVSNFTKELSVVGIGFKAAIEGKNLVLNVGYTHPIKFPIPDNIKMTVEKNIINISGADKQSVGETAAKIRAFKKPEPYQGKGIRYKNEIVRRKAGKKAAAAAGAGAAK